MTIPRRFRLTGKTEFSNVFQQATVSSDACFKVLGRRSGHPHARLGMAVSRQVDPRAVQRNRLKRIIRESFRAHYASKDPASAAPSAADIVVLPRRAAVAASNHDLMKQLARHWRKLDERLLKEKNAPGPAPN